MDMLVGSDYYINIPQSVIVERYRLPEEYHWLASIEESHVIMHIPFNCAPLNTQYQYYSLFHNKTLVNGKSGFVPASQPYLAYLLQSFPDERSLKVLREIGVEIIILYPDHFTRWRRQDIVSRTTHAPDDLRVLKMYPQRWVMQIVQKDEPVTVIPERLYSTIPEGDLLPLQDCQFTSPCVGEKPEVLYDDDSHTRCTLDLLVGKPYLEFSFPSSVNLTGVVIHQGLFPHHSPEGIVISISKNGKEWETIVMEQALPITVPHLIRQAGDFKWTFTFPPVNARHIRVEQIEKQPTTPWSMAELELFGCESSAQ
jgi:hypothetical protein